MRGTMRMKTRQEGTKRESGRGEGRKEQREKDGEGGKEMEKKDGEGKGGGRPLP